VKVDEELVNKRRRVVLEKDAELRLAVAGERFDRHILLQDRHNVLGQEVEIRVRPIGKWWWR
jgi:hypothetical protein